MTGKQHVSSMKVLLQIIQGAAQGAEVTYSHKNEIAMDISLVKIYLEALNVKCIFFGRQPTCLKHNGHALTYTGCSTVY